MTITAVESLRIFAEKQGVLIGTCVNFHALEHDPQYSDTIVRQFNLITPENALKFKALCPRKGEYHFEAVDRLIEYAERNELKVRGHVLVWNDQLPQWLIQGNYSREELIEILIEHIEMVAGRYAGEISVWDVVNEAINEYGNFKRTFWYEGIGPEYIEIAFRTAKRIAPTAKLFYNDYGSEGTYAHEDGVYNLLRNLKLKGVPVDGVGFQMHLAVEHTDDYAIGSINTKRLVDMGLEFNITELDVRLKIDQGIQSHQLLTQAQIYAKVVQNYIMESGCKTIILWGFTDRYSWIPFFYPGEGAATVMTEDFAPKPAFRALMAALDNLSQNNEI